MSDSIRILGAALLIALSVVVGTAAPAEASKIVGNGFTTDVDATI